MRDPITIINSFGWSLEYRRLRQYHYYKSKLEYGVKMIQRLGKHDGPMRLQIHFTILDNKT